MRTIARMVEIAGSGKREAVKQDGVDAEGCASLSRVTPDALYSLPVWAAK
jgi:hypothetical protein